MTRNISTTNSRAEELRRRRLEQGQKRIPSSPGTSGRTRKPAAANPMPARPVVVRNATFGTPIHRQVATSNPRRTYYVALSTPGAELRLPAMPVFHPGWRLLSAAIAILAGIGFLSLAFSPFFRLGAINIVGLERLAPTEIQAVTHLENLSIIEVNPGEVREAISSHFPGLEMVEVKVALPAMVTIQLKERQPIMAWRQGEKVQWIDASGVVFPASGSLDGLITISSPEPPPVSLPRVENQPGAEDATAEAGQTNGSGTLAKPVAAGPARLDPSILETAQKLAAHLPAGTPLVYLPSEGLGWEAPSGCDIFIGSDLSRFEVKLAAVQAIEAELNKQGIVAELINARNLDAPYYRAEK